MFGPVEPGLYGWIICLSHKNVKPRSAQIYAKCPDMVSVRAG